LSIYPNPTSGPVSISVSNNEVDLVSLVNIQGSFIKTLSFELQNDLIQIDLSSEQIPVGVYWLQINDKQGVTGIARLIYQSGF